jgi:hypothetical protein
MTTQATNQSGKPPHEDTGATLHLRISAPREPEPREFTFTKSTPVGEAAREVATAFGYTGGSPTFQNAAGDLLDRGKPLAGEHVKDHDELDLVDVGGGV